MFMSRDCEGCSKSFSLHFLVDCGVCFGLLFRVVDDNLNDSSVAKVFIIKVMGSNPIITELLEHSFQLLSCIIEINAMYSG